MFAEIVAAGATFLCTPTAVWDGDGPIWCAEGPKIRLRGVAARELKRLPSGEIVDAGCKLGHPCPATDAIKARDALASMLGKPSGYLRTGHVRIVAPRALRCVSEGSGKGDRTAAWCYAGAVQVNCAMVRGGYTLRWADYDRERRLCS